MAAAWKSAGASALLDAILYDDAAFSSYRPGDHESAAAAPAKATPRDRALDPMHPSADPVD